MDIPSTQIKRNYNFQLSEHGNAFIVSQIKKGITFFIIGTIILAVISLSSVLDKDGLNKDRIPLGLGIFSCLFAFHLWTWLRGIAIRNRVIKELQVNDDIVTVTVFIALTNSEKIHSFNRMDCYLDKGVDFSENKAVNLFEVEETWKLVVRTPDRNYYYFITTFWPDWSEIKKVFECDGSMP